jgi:hypothetical protein
MVLVFHGDIPSPENNRNGLVSSSDLKQWELKSVQEIKEQLNNQSFRKVITRGVAIVYRFYGVNGRKWELGNKVKSINRVLVLCGVVRNMGWGCISEEHVYFKGVDKKFPRCVVEITFDVQPINEYSEVDFN